MIEMRRAQLGFGDGLIAEEIVAHTVMFGIPIAGIVTLWLRRAKA